MPNPLRVLCVIANPSGLTRFDDARVWREMAEALPVTGRVALERLAEPSEVGLKRALAHGQWHAVHFVVHAQERRAARYGSIALLASDGSARNLTAPILAGLIDASAAVHLVVLEACEPASYCFDIVAEALTEKGTTVAVAPPLGGRERAIFVSKLYAAAAAGLTPGEISKELAAVVGGVRVISANPQAPLFGAPASVIEEPASAPPPPRPPRKDWENALKQKRLAGAFDVFLCHNWADKASVLRIANRLKKASVLPWLDAWELPPGQPWQPLLEQQIGTIKSAAVFVGSAGMGPWQEQEMNAFLREFVQRKAPVIPVLLPDAPSKPDLPIFLRAMTWVDFRKDDPDPLKLLIWGITGQRPED